MGDCPFQHLVLHQPVTYGLAAGIAGWTVSKLMLGRSTRTLTDEAVLDPKPRFLGVGKLLFAPFAVF